MSLFAAPAAIVAPLAPNAAWPLVPLTVPHVALPVATHVASADSVTPVGSGSLTVTLCASDGPAFVTTIVYVAVAPGVYVALASSLVTARSATSVTFETTLLALFAGSGSVMPAAFATVAVFDSTPLAGAVPVIVMTSEPPDGSVGIVPLTTLPATLTDAGQTAPPLGLPQVAPTAVIAAGTLSANVAPFAALGPAFAIASV